MHRVSASAALLGGEQPAQDARIAHVSVGLHEPDEQTEYGDRTHMVADSIVRAMRGNSAMQPDQEPLCTLLR